MGQFSGFSSAALRVRNVFSRLAAQFGMEVRVALDELLELVCRLEQPVQQIGGIAQKHGLD